MSRRINIQQDVIAPELKQVVARPTDTFLQAPQGQVGQVADNLSNVLNIRNALHGVNTQATALIQDEIKLKRDQDIIEGKRLATQNRVAYKEAVDQGAVDKKDNPWVRYGYKQQYAANDAALFTTSLQQAYQQQGFQNEDDVSKVTAWVDEASAQFTQKYQHYPLPIQESLLAGLQKSRNDILGKHEKDRKEAYYAGLEMEYGQGLSDQLSIFTTEQKRLKTGTFESPELKQQALQANQTALQAGVQQILDNAQGTGLTREDALNQSVTTLLNFSRQQGDEDMVDTLGAMLLDYGNGTVRLDSTPAWQEKATGVKEQIRDQAYQDEFTELRRRWNAEREADDAIKEDIIQKSLDGTLTPEYIKQAAKGRPNVAYWGLSMLRRETDRDVREALEDEKVRIDEGWRNGDLSDFNPSTLSPKGEQYLWQRQKQLDKEETSAEAKRERLNAKVVKDVGEVQIEEILDERYGEPLSSVSSRKRNAAKLGKTKDARLLKKKLDAYINSNPSATQDQVTNYLRGVSRSTPQPQASPRPQTPRPQPSAPAPTQRPAARPQQSTQAAPAKPKAAPTGDREEIRAALLRLKKARQGK